jgi:hypothetical protein
MNVEAAYYPYILKFGVVERFDVGVASIARWKNKPEPAKTRNKPATNLQQK